MSRSRNPVNPAAQKALDQLKVETAAELGLQNYQNTYKGALTSADNGRVGGNMVRKMIANQEQKLGGGAGFGQQGQQSKAGQQTLTTKKNIGS